jgi:hypothetical protein
VNPGLGFAAATWRFYLSDLLRLEPWSPGGTLKEESTKPFD